MGVISLSDYSTGMAYNNNNGTMYLLTEYSGSSIYTVSLTDASVSLQATFASHSFYTLAYDESSNLFYSVDVDTRELYSINPSGWGLTLIGTVSFDLGYYFSGSDFNDVTGEFYVSQYDDVNANIYKVNPSDASSQLVRTVANADFIVLALRNHITVVPVSVWVILSVFALIALTMLFRRRLF